jgi:hypothetical protein
MLREGVLFNKELALPGLELLFLTGPKLKLNLQF